MFGLKKLQAYLLRVLAADRFKRFFDNLASGRNTLTTNDVLRWTVCLSSITFLIIYLDLRMDFYIKSNMEVLQAIESSSLSNIELYHIIMENAQSVNLNSYGFAESTFLRLGESSQISYIIFMQKLMLQGLTIEAFGIMLQVISLIRVIILAIRFNIPTSLVMVTISYLAAYVYYIDLVWHLKSLEKDTLRLIYTYEYPQTITNEIAQIKRVYFGPGKSLLTCGVRLITQTIKLGRHEYYLASQDRFMVFHNDPVSLGMRFLVSCMEGAIYIVGRVIPRAQPAFISMCTYIYASLYYISQSIVFPIGQWFMKAGYEYRYFLVYIYGVRKLKAWVPYLIRWHWAMIIVTEPYKTLHLVIFQRTGTYVRKVLLPNYRSAKRDYHLYRLFDPQKYWWRLNELKSGMELAHFKLEVAYTCQYFLLAVFISCYVYGALHAVCGQYFFLPIFTQNAEITIGYRRDSLSVYSGGYTSWQDMDDSIRWRKMWHGVLGRGTEDNVPLILTIFDFIKNLLVKLFRFFKR